MKERHRITQYTLFVSIAGILINLIFSRLAIFFEIPLYLDSIGTILASALGGYLPGIVVGFFSNIINGFADPITLYYAIISILIACAAAFLSGKGWLSNPWKALLSIPIFTFIGGGLGSTLTWMLYGFNFGSGITAPFAYALYETAGFSQFYAQLVADLGVDFVDKFIMVLVCFAVLRLIPAKTLEKISSGRFRADGSFSTPQNTLILFKRSLRSKVVLLIAVTALILGFSAIGIGYILYTDTMTEHYTSVASGVAESEVGVIDADSINRYLSTGVKDDGYFVQESRLKYLLDSVPDIEYIYVYQIRGDGCHVVFDIDTPELEAAELGDVIPIEGAFIEYQGLLMAGEPIPPVISNGAYGWLLTSYARVVDSSGKTVAYAAADIAMGDVISDRAAFIIKMASLLFGTSIVIVAFALWFSERRLVDPINAMAEAASNFANDSEGEKFATTERLQKLDIHTGDEIENLYDALKKTVTDVSEYIADIKRKNQIISQMQHNIIVSFANMVESRDMNTGEHIKHTAAYVGEIAGQLMHAGAYPDTIDDGYIEKIVRSAPLHDLGKIEVPDAILNKPGKLTAEEFERMKVHTIAGRELLRGIIDNSSDAEYLSEAVNMAYYHHERWDGTGYPEGLKGEQIPLSARIMAVADVYDALISKRSYKEALSREEAERVIIAESGTHFDPAVVSAFLAARISGD